MYVTISWIEDIKNIIGNFLKRLACLEILSHRAITRPTVTSTALYTRGSTGVSITFHLPPSVLMLFLYSTKTLCHCLFGSDIPPSSAFSVALAANEGNRLIAFRFFFIGVFNGCTMLTATTATCWLWAMDGRRGCLAAIIYVRNLYVLYSVRNCSKNGRLYVKIVWLL